jgi:hypothetical protein
LPFNSFGKAALLLDDGTEMPGSIQPLAILRPVGLRMDRSTAAYAGSSSELAGYSTSPAANAGSSNPSTDKRKASSGGSVAHTTVQAPAKSATCRTPAAVRDSAAAVFAAGRKTGLLETLLPADAEPLPLATAPAQPAGGPCSTGSPVLQPSAEHPLGSGSAGWTGPLPSANLPEIVPLLSLDSRTRSVPAQAPTGGDATPHNQEYDGAGLLQASLLAQAAAATADSSPALAAAASAAVAEGGNGSNSRQQSRKPGLTRKPYNKLLFDEYLADCETAKQKLANASAEEVLQLVAEYRPADAGDSSRAYWTTMLLLEEVCKRFDDDFCNSQPLTAAAASSTPAAGATNNTASSSSTYSLSSFLRDSVIISSNPGCTDTLHIMPWPFDLIARLLNPGLDLWLQLPYEDLARKLAVRGLALEIYNDEDRDGCLFTTWCCGWPRQLPVWPRRPPASSAHAAPQRHAVRMRAVWPVRQGG